MNVMELFNKHVAESNIDDATNFLRGELDCLAGFKPESDNKDYMRGYTARYELEQMLGEITK